MLVIYNGLVHTFCLPIEHGAESSSLLLQIAYSRRPCVCHNALHEKMIASEQRLTVV